MEPAHGGADPPASRPIVGKTAKIFQNGGSQAVRIPSEYRFDTEEVTIQQVGNQLVIRPKITSENRWDEFFAKWPPDPDFPFDRDNELYKTKDIF